MSFLAVLIGEVICECSKRMGSGDWRKLLDASCYWSIGGKQVAWEKALGITNLPNPTFSQGDICHAIPKSEAYDIVVSWSTFEHLSAPKIALQNAIRPLRPGGVLYIGIHLYTSNSGPHDLRAFTGFPLPFWAHLRASTSHSIQPSSYLNEWRLSRAAIAF